MENDNPKPINNPQVSLAERYKILIEARNFHYDNFNKWMTYFYVAIGALFVGYCTIVSSEKNNVILEYLLTFLGFIVGLLWYWSAKGYYYWNINFIMLVNYYEKDLLKFNEKERIYFVFANKSIQNDYLNPVSGANISTSKIAILFSFIITSVWGFLLYHTLFSNIRVCNCTCIFSIFLELLLSIMTIFIVSAIIPEEFLISNHKHFPDLELENE